MMLYTAGIVLILCFQHVKTEMNMTGCSSSYPPYHVDASRKGDIYSPGYEDGRLPDQLYCEYHIRAPEGRRIKLTLKDIDIETYDKCGRGMMYIHDGPDNDAPLYGIYCGNDSPIISSKNSLYIVTFITQFLVGKRGYHMQYELLPTDKTCPDGYSECRNHRCYMSNRKCDGRDDCGDGTDEERCNLPVSKFTCGVNIIQPIQSSSYSLDRVVGGIEARPGSWPWQADLQVRHYHPNGHQCGGTLIHPQWLITATHCLIGHPVASEWRIQFGNHHKFKKDPYEQIRYVERLVMYPGYTGDDIIGKSLDLNHDFTLMKLNAPVTITDHVVPACVPEQDLQVPIGTTCTATGWGTTRGTGHSDKLKQVDLTTQPINVCRGANNITKICVKSERGPKDVCHGDSGGPLVCKFGNAWKVMGVTSYGISENFLSGLCAVGDTGTVFNAVAKKTEWIYEMIKKYS